MFTSGSNFASRLSAVEKANILMSSNDGLDYLFHAIHKYEFSLPLDEAKAAFEDAVEIVKNQFKTKSAESFF